MNSKLLRKEEILKKIDNLKNINISELITKNKKFKGFREQKKMNKMFNKKNNNAMFVGGCVRDYLLTGKIVDDIDISTILHPNEVANLFYQYKKNNKDIDVVILDKDKSYGTIVVISSLMGLVPFKFMGIYGSTKSSLINFNG